MNVDRDSTGAVPPSVWEHRDMRVALAARDLKTVYERLQRVGVSQRRIASLTDQTASEIYEVLKGRRVMAYDVLARIADGLGIPRGYLGLAYDESTVAALDLAVATCSSQANERDEVRHLLTRAANITMGTEVDGVARWWQPVDRDVAPAPAHIGASDVEQIEALAAALRALDRRHGGGACRDAVAAHVRWAQQLLLATCDESTSVRLHLAVADLHGLAAWTSFDVGMFSTARRHFARALEHAKYVGDLPLTAKVLYGMGRLHLHRGMHRDALRFFQLGQIVAQDCGCELTVAMLCANEAWTYAMLDNPAPMRRSISRAQDESARADHANAPAWIRFFGDADLHACIGVALSALPTATGTDLTASIEHTGQALALRGPDMARSRIFELIALAVACLRVSDRDGGLRAGRSALTTSASVRSIRTLDRLAPLQALAGEQADDSDLRQMSHEIAMLRTPA